MKHESEIIKSRIRLSHTYRHLKLNRVEQNFYLWLLIIPILVIYLFNYANLSYYISGFIRDVLSQVIPRSSISLSSASFLPFFGDITYVSLPTAEFQAELNYLTLGISLVALLLLCTGKRKGHPLSIFISIGLIIQIISSIFFVFAASDFPYTASIYSELYMKQQIGLWLFFFIVVGLVTALAGNGYFFYNVTFLVGIMLYSFIYGVLRYVTYLYIVSQFSTIYMAILFFVFGPLFDFLYIIYFYGLYVNRIIIFNDSKKREDVWQW